MLLHHAGSMSSCGCFKNLHSARDIEQRKINQWTTPAFTQLTSGYPDSIFEISPGLSQVKYSQTDRVINEDLALPSYPLAILETNECGTTKCCCVVQIQFQDVIA
ncbi:Protein of unknown function [Pyronema omphalodes CBS 100304]|uniref:Uncharacterized protein n=1 Tax=Pyronema omphalodes (strain CBS 100304) TaxID=1076935 RepID=U4KZS0_PYROM|nr:Protein of unknown function [Pyronema omphalodes CBS 100304]